MEEDSVQSEMKFSVLMFVQG